MSLPASSMSAAPRRLSMVILVQAPFSWRDRARYGVELLASLGVEVAVMDVSALVFPHLVPDRDHYRDMADPPVTLCDTPGALRDHAERLAAADIVVCSVGSGFYLPENYPVLHTLSRSGTPFLVISSNALPMWAAGRAGGGVRGLLTRLRGLDPRRPLFGRIPRAWLGLRPADFAIHGGRKSRVVRPLFTGATRSIAAHAFDYDVFLAERARPAAETETAVFIDQNAGYQRDADAMGIRHVVTPAVFYPQLRRLFDRIERRLGLEVVIAAHPRADYAGHPGLFGERRIVFGETSRLIRESRLVINSYSTAVNWAVLFEKPVLFYASRELVGHPYLSGVVEQAVAALGRRLLFVDDAGEPDFGDALEWDRERYRAYREDYIKEPGTPEQPSWQIVLDALRYHGIGRP